MNTPQMVELYQACINSATGRIVDYNRALQLKSEKNKIHIVEGANSFDSGVPLGPDEIRGSRVLGMIMLVLYKEITEASTTDKSKILAEVAKGAINDRAIIDWVGSHPEAVERAYRDLRSMRKFYVHSLAEEKTKIEGIYTERIQIDKAISDVGVAGQSDLMKAPTDTTFLAMPSSWKEIGSVSKDACLILKDQFSFLDSKAAKEIKVPFVKATKQEASESDKVYKEMEHILKNVHDNIANFKKEAKGESLELKDTEKSVNDALRDPLLSSVTAQTAGLDAMKMVLVEHALALDVKAVAIAAAIAAAKAVGTKGSDVAKIAGSVAAKVAAGGGNLDRALMAGNIASEEIAKIPASSSDYAVRIKSVIDVVVEGSIAHKAHTDMTAVESALKKSVEVAIYQINAGKGGEIPKVAGTTAAAELMRDGNEISVQSAVGGAIAAFEQGKNVDIIQSTAIAAAEAAKNFEKLIKNTGDDAEEKARKGGITNPAAVRAAAIAAFGDLKAACLAAGVAVIDATIHERPTAIAESIAAGNNARYLNQNAIQAAVEIARQYPRDIELQNSAALFASTLTGSNIVAIATTKAIINKKFPGNAVAISAAEKGAIAAFSAGRFDTFIEEAEISAYIAINYPGNVHALNAALAVIQKYKTHSDRIEAAYIAARVAVDRSNMDDGLIAADLRLGLSFLIEDKKASLNSNTNLIKTRQKELDDANEKISEIERDIRDLNAERLKLVALGKGVNKVDEELNKKTAEHIVQEKRASDAQKGLTRMLTARPALETKFNEFVTKELEPGIIRNVNIQKNSVLGGALYDTATLQAIVTLMAEMKYNKPGKDVKNIPIVSKVIAESFVGKGDFYKAIDAVLKVASDTNSDPDTWIYTQAAILAGVGHVPVHDKDNKALQLSQSIVKNDIGLLSSADGDKKILKAVALAIQILDTHLTKNMFEDTVLNETIMAKERRGLNPIEQQQQDRAIETVKLYNEAANAAAKAAIISGEESAGKLAAKVVIDLRETKYAELAGAVAGHVAVHCAGKGFLDDEIYDFAMLGARAAISAANSKREATTRVGTAIDPVEVARKMVENTIDALATPSLASSRASSPSGSSISSSGVTTAGLVAGMAALGGGGTGGISSTTMADALKRAEDELKRKEEEAKRLATRLAAVEHEKTMLTSALASSTAGGAGSGAPTAAAMAAKQERLKKK